MPQQLICTTAPITLPLGTGTDGGEQQNLLPVDFELGSFDVETFWLAKSKLGSGGQLQGSYLGSPDGSPFNLDDASSGFSHEKNNTGQSHSVGTEAEVQPWGNLIIQIGWNGLPNSYVPGYSKQRIICTAAGEAFLLPIGVGQDFSDGQDEISVVAFAIITPVT